MKTMKGGLLLRTAAAAVMLALPAMARAQSWYSVLSGANEVPANLSTATGYSQMTLTGNSLFFTISWAGLTGGNASAAHIHCCGPLNTIQPVAVPFTNFPTTLSGTYSNTFDLSLTATYTSAFLSAHGGTAVQARADLIAGFNSGNAYTNIHNAAFPAGEIRGLVQVAPEPSSVALMFAGLLAVGAAVRRRRKNSRTC